VYTSLLSANIKNKVTLTTGRNLYRPPLSSLQQGDSFLLYKRISVYRGLSCECDECKQEKWRQRNTYFGSGWQA